MRRQLQSRFFYGNNKAMRVACYIDNITNYQISQPGSFFCVDLGGGSKKIASQPTPGGYKKNTGWVYGMSNGYRKRKTLGAH